MLTKLGTQRRKLIEKATGSMLLYPLLRVLDSSEASAANPYKPRIIFVYFGAGATEKHFWPQGGSGPIGDLPIASKPLNDLRGDMILFKGLCTRGGTNHDGGMHQALAAWGGAGGNMATRTNMESKPNSMDQVLADKWAGTTGLRSLHLGCQTQFSGNPFTKTISFRNGQEQTPLDNPKAALDTAFGNFTVPSGGTTMQAEAVTNVALGKKRIMDYLSRDMKRIENSLGGYEKESFQYHVTAIDDLNTEVDAQIKNIKAPTTATSIPTTAANCSPKAITSRDGEWYMDAANATEVFNLHRKIMVQAMACNVTRVGVWQMGNSHQENKMFLDGVTFGEPIHALAHTMTETYARAVGGFMGQVASLARDLKGCVIGDHNIFDETLIYVCTDLADIPNDHSGVNVATFTLGNPLKNLTTNRMISYPYEKNNYTNGNGKHYSHALISAAHAVGETSVNMIGYTQAQGPLAEYFAR